MNVEMAAHPVEPSLCLIYVPQACPTELADILLCLLCLLTLLYIDLCAMLQPIQPYKQHACHPLTSALPFLVLNYAGPAVILNSCKNITFCFPTSHCFHYF